MMRQRMTHKAWEFRVLGSGFRGAIVFFLIGVAHSGLACLCVSPVPWSSGPLVFGCGSWKVTNTQHLEVLKGQD